MYQTKTSNQQTFRILISLTIVTLLASTAYAKSNDPFVEGIHYYNLSNPQPVETGDKIEVKELFWYRCPHCFYLEPNINSWLKTKPANSELVRQPAILRQDWVIHGRVYYTLEALGEVERMHSKVFEAIHEKKIPLTNIDQVKDLASSNEIDAATWMDAWDSFAVNTRLQQAAVSANKYEITGVPAIIVDGKYRASAQSAGGQDELMKLTNFLIQKATNERSK